MAIHEKNAEGDSKLDQWQDYFSKQFSNLLHGSVKSGVIRCRQNFSNPSYLFHKRVGAYQKPMAHKKPDDCSDRYFVPPIVITVKTDGSVKLALEQLRLVS